MNKINKELKNKDAQYNITKEITEREDKILEIRNLKIKYEDRLILNNINWIVRKGELWALIGENGSGKTTLSRAIIGITKNYTGTIKKYGNIIYLPQHLRKEMMPFKVKEVIEIFSIKEELIKYFELEEHKNKSIDELSGGLYQTLFISLALSTDAELYILDEPQTNLDKKREMKLYNILKKYTLEGKAVILITHEVGFVKENIEHIACIHKGEQGLNFHCALDEKSIIRHAGLQHTYNKHISTR